MRQSLTFVLMLAAAPAFAGLAEDTDPRACVAGAIAANTPAADCVELAQRPCFAFEPGSTAGVACFVDSQDQWTGMIAERLAGIRAAATDRVSAVAAIEVKHDVLQHLNECDRMEALALVRDAPSEHVNWQKSRCVATALGLALVKLLAQSQDIP